MVKYNKKSNLIFKGFNSFKTFSNFMEKTFIDVTYQEISVMFRDCYSIGRGYINCDIFLSVANECNFFVKFIK